MSAKLNRPAWPVLVLWRHATNTTKLAMRVDPTLLSRMDTMELGFASTVRCADQAVGHWRAYREGRMDGWCFICALLV